MSGTRRRAWRWLAIALLSLAGLALVGWLLLPRLLGSQRVLDEVAARLSAALGRRVTIERMEVDADEAAVTLFGVSVADPPEFGGGALLTADTIRLDVTLASLRHGTIEGALASHGVALRLVRQGGTTNLHGLGAGRPPSDGADPVGIDLSVALSEAEVTFDDRDAHHRGTLQGVAVQVALSSRDATRAARVDIQVARADFGPLAVHEIDVQGVLDDDALTLHHLGGRVGREGRIAGTGEISIADVGTPAQWSMHLTVRDAAIDADLAPLAAALFVPLSNLPTALAADPDARWGRLTADVRVAGQGLAWAAVRPTLSGQGTLTLRDVQIPARSVLARVASLAGHGGGPMTLARGRVEFVAEDGWVVLQRVTGDGGVVVPPIAGRVALDGRLDLSVDLMPLVQAYGGGIYERLRGISSTIPVRVGGTLQDPDLKPPTPASLTKGLIGGLVHRAMQPSSE